MKNIAITGSAGKAAPLSLEPLQGFGSCAGHIDLMERSQLGGYGFPRQHFLIHGVIEPQRDPCQDDHHQCEGTP